MSKQAINEDLQPQPANEVTCREIVIRYIEDRPNKTMRLKDIKYTVAVGAFDANGNFSPMSPGELNNAIRSMGKQFHGNKLKLERDELPSGSLNLIEETIPNFCEKDFVKRHNLTEKP